MTAHRLSRSLSFVAAVAVVASTLAACASEPAAAPPTPTSPPRVLLVGDSILFDAAPAVSAALAAAGVPTVVDPVLGLGLTRGPYFDWRSHWRTQIQRHDPDVVFVHIGPFDLVPTPVDGRPLEPGVPGWSPWYAGLLDEAAGILAAGGAAIRWISSPPYAKPGWHPDVPAFNRELTALAGRDGRVAIVDGFGALSDHGRFLPELRKDDGIHLCPSGAERMADLVLASLGMTPARDDAWRRSAWRHDPRYAAGLEGGHCPVPA